MNIEEAVLLLKIEGDITCEKVNAAFKKLASKFHPDKGGDTNEMARINEAREVLQEHMSVENTPAVIKQFELCIKEMNVVAREQRFLEKRVEKSEKDIIYSATNRLKSYKNIALALAAISTASFFLGKDIPEDLTSLFAKEAVAVPALVSKPIESNLVELEKLKTSKNNKNNDAHELTTEETLDLQKKTSKEEGPLSHNAFGFKYASGSSITNNPTLMWYAVTFSIGIYAGICSWVLNQRIRKIEEELEELLDDLSFKFQYVKILSDLFEGKYNDSWTFEHLFEAVSQNSYRNHRLRPLVRYVGSKKITQLLINKGLESSSLIVKHGGKENNYEETYSLS